MEKAIFEEVTEYFKLDERDQATDLGSNSNKVL